MDSEKTLLLPYRPCVGIMLVNQDNKIFAVGGRVLNFVSLSDNFNDAKINITKNLNKLNWPGGFYRKDIGYKVIE